MKNPYFTKTLQIIRNFTSKCADVLLSSHLGTVFDIALYSCFCRMCLDGQRYFRYYLPGASLRILENYISEVFGQMLGARCAVHAHRFLYLTLEASMYRVAQSNLKLGV